MLTRSSSRSIVAVMFLWAGLFPCAAALGQPKVESEVVDAPPKVDEGGTAKERKLFKEVMDRLLQTERVRKNYPATFVWPPTVFIEARSDKKDANAAVGFNFNPITKKIYVNKKGQPFTKAFITESMMREVVDSNEDILAAMMGHELGHLTLGHVGKPGFVDLEGLAVNRKQEFDADREGVLIAVAAGFPNKNGVRMAFRAWKALKGRPGFHPNASTHPTWLERLTALDREQAEIWKAMSAFENGYFLLQAEQYRSAEACLKSIVDDSVKDGPQLAEVWANLGYARLMQYCDGLTEKDLREYGIGQFVAGCFYERPTGLVPIRGDAKMWRAAVDALETALKHDPNLVLPRANLGLAYLVHPDGKKPDQALEHFRKVDSKKDKGLDGLSRSAFLVNYGVAEMAKGLHREARDHFLAAQKIPAKSSALLDQLDTAILFNLAMLDAEAGGQTNLDKAFRGHEQYLAKSTSASAWWNVAYERYENLGKATDTPIKTRDVLVNAFAQNVVKKHPDMLLRTVATIDLSTQGQLALGDSTVKTLKALDREQLAGIPIYPNSIVKRYAQVSPGVSIVADEKVLAIFLSDAKTPPIFVQPRGTGAKPKELRVGMKLGEFDAVLKGAARTFHCYVDHPNSTYDYYPALGLAARIQNGEVRELVLTQVAQQAVKKQ